MALVSRDPRALTIVRTCTVMLIFRLAGCAAAHGKRSDGQVGDILVAKASSNESPRNGVAPSSKTQWILSRLIAGQPVLPLPAKYRVRWSGLAKDRDVYASPKWEYDAGVATYDEDVEPIRIPINNESNEKKINNAQDTIAMPSTNEELGNVPEIVLISPDGYRKPINGFRKLDVLEFLVRLDYSDDAADITIASDFRTRGIEMRNKRTKDHKTSQPERKFSRNLVIEVINPP
ncbi:hypothetical protein HN011_012118 [Eciton burchellii]|nr:hypothetical protein HN011_012118 [Eciton burchellii]